MSIGISLGWNCYTTDLGVRYNIRDLKKNGYKTCPFDLMISNYYGVIECIKTDFKYILEPSCYELIAVSPDALYCTGDMLIFNNKYKFIYNHESPGHANLYINENWENGKTHYINNNYEKLIERMRRRVENFYEYINSGKHINFIITYYKEDVSELFDCLKLKFPNLKFSIIRFDLEDRPGHYYEHLKLMQFNDNDREIRDYLESFWKK